MAEDADVLSKWFMHAGACVGIDVYFSTMELPAVVSHPLLYPWRLSSSTCRVGAASCGGEECLYSSVPHHKPSGSTTCMQARV